MKFRILLLNIVAFYVTLTLSVDLPDDDHQNCRMHNWTWFRDNWMEVPLDHFNLFDNRTWNMRYLMTDHFFEDNGPLIIEVGGEWTINGCDLVHGQLAILAEKHKSMLVETEHRFYGRSLPFSTNFSTENLKYLQIEQAIEDVAYFIEHFKEANPRFKNSTVVVHGCSYPGMLVTWLRLRFPHIVDIAYASSAPLGVGLDYPEFFEVVNDVYANVSSECIDTVRRGFNITQKLLRTEEGQEIVRDALRDWNCGDIDDMNSVEIIWKLIGVFNVMHDPSQYEDVACLVMAMDTDDMDAFQRMAKFVVLKSNDIADCKDSEEDPMGDRNNKAWNYQTCTEMGTFQTLNRANSRHPFAVDANLEESVKECTEEFGDIVTKEVLQTGNERVIRRYGGLRPKVTKVLTIQGDHDPWRHLADTQDYTSDAPVWLIQGSHCLDFSQPSNDDSEDLKKVRKSIRDHLSKWIEELS